MVDTVIVRRRSRVQQQRLENGGVRGIQELGGRKLTIIDIQDSGGDLMLKVASNRCHPGLMPSPIKQPAHPRHPFRHADHRP